MEKKRLLSALMAAALAAWAAPALAEEDPLRGIRTKPEKAALAGAEKLKEKLYEPDFAGAQKMLSEIKTPKAAQTAQIMELLSVKPPPAGMPPQKTTGTKGSESKLFYFFSFSMPRLSLREAAAESAAAGAVMVLRGLYEDDPAKTASRISEMIGRSGAEVWIDPRSFRVFFGKDGAADCACPQTLAGCGLQRNAPRKGFGGRVCSLRPGSHKKGGCRCRGVYQTPS